MELIGKSPAVSYRTDTGRFPWAWPERYRPAVPGRGMACAAPSTCVMPPAAGDSQLGTKDLHAPAGPHRVADQG